MTLPPLSVRVVLTCAPYIAADATCRNGVSRPMVPCTSCVEKPFLPRICSRSLFYGGRRNPSVIPRCGSLLLAISADVRALLTTSSSKVQTRPVTSFSFGAGCGLWHIVALFPPCIVDETLLMEAWADFIDQLRAKMGLELTQWPARSVQKLGRTRTFFGRGFCSHALEEHKGADFTQAPACHTEGTSGGGGGGGNVEDWWMEVNRLESELGQHEARLKQIVFDSETGQVRISSMPSTMTSSATSAPSSLGAPQPALLEIDDPDLNDTLIELLAMQRSANTLSWAGKITHYCTTVHH